MFLLVPILAHSSTQGRVPPTWVEHPVFGKATVFAPTKLAEVDAGEIPADTGLLKVWIAKVGTTVFEVSAQTPKDPKGWDPNSALAEYAEGLINPEYKVVGERDLVVQGWPGVAITCTLKSGFTMVARAFTCDHAVVSVTSMYPTQQSRPAEVDTFLDSLSFKKSGELKTVGIPLARYDLGESGMSALFPRKPTRFDAPASKSPSAQVTHMFSTSYAQRAFGVVYRDSKDPQILSASSDLKSSLYSAAIKEVAGAFGATAGKQTEFKLGSDVGVCADAAATGKLKGKVVVFLRGSRLVTVFEIGPEVYDSPNTIESFLKSVEFK